MLDTKQKVADLVISHSECAEIFHRHRIDFCCGGQVSLEDAATQQQIDLDSLVAEITEAIEARRQVDHMDLRALSNAKLIEHIVSTHHAYLRSVMPFVRKLSAKVARVHGERNPKLLELDALLKVLDETLLPHLDEEEAALFPRLVEAADPDALQPMLREMFDEHRAVGHLLAKLREASDDFEAPSWACGSYRTLIAEIDELQRDVHLHVHVENNVLAPRFARSAS